MKLKITLTTEAIVAAGKSAREEMARRWPELLRVIGTRLLSLNQQSYIDKARGGGGADGIPWRKLQVGTILARMRKRKVLGKGGKVLKGGTQNTALFRSLKKQGAVTITSGKARRSGNKNMVRKGDTVKAADRTMRVQAIHAGRKSKNTKKISGTGGFEIGVDTGLQRASASPGYRGTDGKGGNIFDVGRDQVTVGYGRSYSKYFDQARPLIPDPLPAAWTQDFEQRANVWATDIIQRNFGTGTGTGK